MKENSKKPLAFEVADKLRLLIRKNELHSGMKLSEPELCKQLGVSRTPLREAFRMLAAEGLLDIRLNKGTYVVDPPLDDVFHMFEAMGIMEGNCARLACERLTDADLAEIERLHAHLEEQFKKNDPERYLDINHEYHTFIQEKAGNPVLSKMVSSLREVILLHRYRSIRRPGRLLESIEEHRRIIEALRARDGRRAERLMWTHLQKQGQALVSYYAEYGYSKAHNN